MSEIADKKPTMVDQIAEYVDSFLGKKAALLDVDKIRLSVYLRIIQSGALEILLYRDREFIGYVKMKEVLGGGLVAIFTGTVENKIVNGFKQFAQEHQYDITKLLLELSHENDILIYKVWFDSKHIEVNLEEFFTPKKEE